MSFFSANMRFEWIQFHGASACR